MNKGMSFFKNNINSTVYRYYAFSFLKSAALFSAVLVPFYTQWGNLQQSQIQILQSFFMLWIFLLEVPTGVIADKYGRKFSIGLGALIFAVAALVYGSIPRFEIFLLGEFLAAVGVSLISGADDALLYDALKEAGVEENSKKVFGRARSFELAGIFVAAPIGSLVAAKLGLNAPFLFTAIPFFLAALIGWSIKEPKIKESKSESKRYLDIAINGLKFFMSHKTLRRLALDSILVSAAGYFIIWLYQPLLIKVGVPIIYFGLLHALLVASQIVVASNFVRLEKLFHGAKNLLAFSAVITGITFAVAGLYPSLVTALLFITLAGGFGLTRGELMGVYLNRLIQSHQRATVLSSISMFRRLFLVLLNPIVGFTADRSLNLALLGVGLLPLLVFLFSPLEKEMFKESKD